MKNPLAGVKNRLGELKGRTLLIVIGIVVVLIVIILYAFSGGSSSGLATSTGGKASTVRAPSIESTPGVSDVHDEAYIQLQRQANEQIALEAIKRGTSAVATVTSDQFVNELTIPEPGLASIGGTTPAQQKKREETALAQYQDLYQEQLRQEKLREQERMREQAMAQEEAYQDAFEGLMQGQAKSLMGQWQPVTQTYTHVPQEAAADRFGGRNENLGLPPLYKAGDVIFGVMETSVNSDEPGPVMARVVSGTLAGSKLVGSFRRIDDQVIIEFSLLNAPELASSIPIRAVAIDPQTARTALATDVDYHRLLRYSTLFASAFLEGVGEAVLASIQPDFTLAGSTDTITFTNVETTTKDQLLVGLGEVGTKMGEKLDPIFDMPPTVTVDSGTAIGLLFTEDFSLEPGTQNNIQIIQEENLAQPTLTPANLNTGAAPAGTTSTKTAQ